MSRLIFNSIRDINLPGWVVIDEFHCSKKVPEGIQVIVSKNYSDEYQVQLYISEESSPELEYRDRLIASCIGVAEGWLKNYRDAKIGLVKH